MDRKCRVCSFCEVLADSEGVCHNYSQPIFNVDDYTFCDKWSDAGAEFRRRFKVFHEKERNRQMSQPLVDRFFMVWGDSDKSGWNNKPTVRHPTATAAAEEAERLAAKSPGTVYYILEVKGAYAIPKAKPQYFGTREGDYSPLEK